MIWQYQYEYVEVGWQSTGCYYVPIDATMWSWIGLAVAFDKWEPRRS